MNTIGIIVNTSKPKAAEVVAEASHWLRSKGIKPLLPDEKADALSIPCDGYTQEQVVKQSDALIVLGGDGTLLGVAHVPSVDEVPILGVNIGHLGYLTEVALSELYHALTNILEGNYEIKERMMLKVQLYHRGKMEMQSLALNDAFIKHPSRMINIEVYIDGQYFVTYNADGLIIATPTGSTAYSLAVGGPIVEPNMQAIILSPIASHALTIRPFVAHPDSQISVSTTEHSGVILAVDGDTICLEPDCAVKVGKAEKTIKLIKSKNRSYYEVLRTKLKLGERGE
ncbi:MAG: NAD(+)/NADH kinase [Candidatus Poribacteria bacterium]